MTLLEDVHFIALLSLGEAVGGCQCRRTWGLGGPQGREKGEHGGVMGSHSHGQDGGYERHDEENGFWTTDVPAEAGLGRMGHSRVSVADRHLTTVRKVRL